MIPDNFNQKELSSDGTVFCAIGSPLALNLMRITSRATESFGVIELDVMKRAIDDAFEELRVHWLTCRMCIEDDPCELDRQF